MSTNHDDGSYLFDGGEALHSWERGQPFKWSLRPTPEWRDVRWQWRAKASNLRPLPSCEPASRGAILFFTEGMLPTPSEFRKAKTCESGEMAVTLYFEDLDIRHLLSLPVTCSLPVRTVFVIGSGSPTRS